jgi:hypothetical protein
MRLIRLTLVLFFIVSCSDVDIEKIAFRETLQHNLKELCGEEDKPCIAAVEAQTERCMEQSNWRQYMSDEDNEEEYERFVTEFYSCIVDPQGQPYFAPSV